MSSSTYINLPNDTLDVTSSNPSIGPNGQPAPTSSTEIAGIDGSGNLIPVQVDSNGVVQVNTNVSNTVTVQEAGLNTFKTSQYVVGGTEIQITTVPLANRSSISLKVVADSPNAIFFSGVSGSVLTDGYPLYNGDSVQMDLTPSGVIYVQATASGQQLYVLEIA